MGNKICVMKAFQNIGVLKKLKNGAFWIAQKLLLKNSIFCSLLGARLFVLFFKKYSAAPFNEARFAEIHQNAIAQALLKNVEGVIAKRGALQRTNGKTALVGALSPEIFSFLKNKGIKITNAAILMPDYKFDHATRPQKRQRGAALSDEVFKNLLAYLLCADVYWDNQKENLVYFFKVKDLPKGKVAKIAVRLGIKQEILISGVRVSLISNFVATGGMEYLKNIRHAKTRNGKKRFEKIERK